MSVTRIARCDGPGCRHSGKVLSTAPAGWSFALPCPAAADDPLHACCGTCRKDIDARRARMQLPALQWTKEGS